MWGVEDGHSARPRCEGETPASLSRHSHVVSWDVPSSSSRAIVSTMVKPAEPAEPAQCWSLKPGPWHQASREDGLPSCSVVRRYAEFLVLWSREPVVMASPQNLALPGGPGWGLIIDCEWTAVASGILFYTPTTNSPSSPPIFVLQSERAACLWVGRFSFLHASEGL